MEVSAQSLRIAFYAPLKSPDHPVPSGDRQMARMLIACLEGAGHRVEVISHLRAYLPSSDDAQHWAALQAEAAAERDRIREGWRGGKPDLIFCYHNYYKSPDLIGHPLARDFAIPYMTCEASYSDRRNIGIWTEAQDMAREGARDAALNLSFTARDKEGLHDAVPEARVARFPPFIDTRPFHAEPQPEPGHIVTVAMMRPGDKLDSYRHLAEALRHLPSDLDWYLSIAGDGPARGEVEALFAALPAARLNWLGALPLRGLQRSFRAEASCSGPVAARLTGLPISKRRRRGCRWSPTVWPGCRRSYPTRRAARWWQRATPKRWPRRWRGSSPILRARRNWAPKRARWSRPATPFRQPRRGLAIWSPG